MSGRKHVVSGHYVLAGHRRIGMAVGAYNARARLVIDPVLVYATYLGGSGDDSSHSIVVDGAGAAYVTGETASANFPTVHALRPRFDSGPRCVRGEDRRRPLTPLRRRRQHRIPRVTSPLSSPHDGLSCALPEHGFLPGRS